METTNGLARIILLVAFVVFVPVAIYYRLRSRTNERLDRRQERWLIVLSLRLLGLGNNLTDTVVAPRDF